MGEQAITCIIENGNIYKLEFGQKNCIGVTADIFTNLKNNAEKALNRNEELAQERSKNIVLENRIYSDAQFNALNTRLSAIDCELSKLPKTAPLYLQGVSCSGQLFPTAAAAAALV